MSIFQFLIKGWSSFNLLWDDSHLNYFSDSRELSNHWQRVQEISLLLSLSHSGFVTALYEVGVDQSDLDSSPIAPIVIDIENISHNCQSCMRFYYKNHKKLIQDCWNLMNSYIFNILKNRYGSLICAYNVSWQTATGILLITFALSQDFFEQPIVCFWKKTNIQFFFFLSLLF